MKATDVREKVGLNTVWRCSDQTSDIKIRYVRTTSVVEKLALDLQYIFQGALVRARLPIKNDETNKPEKIELIFRLSNSSEAKWAVKRGG